jgi:hypothetical protein
MNSSLGVSKRIWDSKMVNLLQLASYTNVFFTGMLLNLSAQPFLITLLKA